MTHLEKINELKETIVYLYEKEGRGKKYISNLLKVDYRILCQVTNEWNLTKANINYLTPSNEKFVKKNKVFIQKRLEENSAVSEIAKELKITRDYLYYLIKRVPELQKSFQEKENRELQIKLFNKQKEEEKKKEYYNYTSLPGEIWKTILGYEDYEVSNKARVRKYSFLYDAYKLIKPYPNVRNGRLYVMLYNENKRANLQLARLVGFAFVEGYSKINNTINHKDLNVENNLPENLEWIPQAENNNHAYKNGRAKAYAYGRHGKFKKIILNDKYEFKTIRACAKFLNISETQMHRYIDKECISEKVQKIELIY